MGGVSRARALLQMAIGPAAEPDKGPGPSPRCQLLTAFTGTALQAWRDGASRAALVIHEFQGPRTRAALLERNAADLKASLRFLNGGGQWLLLKATLSGSGLFAQAPGISRMSMHLWQEPWPC